MKKITQCLFVFLLTFPLFAAVEFLGFSADIQAEHVLLTWSTATETANLGFILERKSDPLAVWAPFTSYMDNDALAGQGTVSSPTDYSYLDTTVAEGQTYYYRISGVDEANNIGVLDSLFIRVSNVSVDEFLPDHINISAFPNPFNPETIIRYRVPEASFVEISIHDIRGIPVECLYKRFTPAGEHDLIWTASNISGGIYLIILRYGERIQSHKLVLLK